MRDEGHGYNLLNSIMSCAYFRVGNYGSDLPAAIMIIAGCKKQHPRHSI